MAKRKRQKKTLTERQATARDISMRRGSGGVIYESRTDALLAAARNRNIQRIQAGLDRLEKRMIAMLSQDGTGEYYDPEGYWSKIQPKIADTAPDGHVASAAGSAPASLSGDLIKSIQTEVIPSRVSIKHPAYADVQGTIWIEGTPGMQDDPAIYAMALEFGNPGGNGKKGGPVAPRPFFGPSYQGSRGEIRKMLEFPWDLTGRESSLMPSGSNSKKRASRYVPVWKDEEGGEE